MKSLPNSLIVRPAFLLSACALLCLASCLTLWADPGRLTVHVDQPGHRISPTLYGLMTEEINHSYDGGLYGELIQNRAFKDDPDQPIHWALVQDGGGTGAIAIDKRMPLSDALPVSLRLTMGGSGGRVGVANDGYWGIPVRPSTTYHASFYALGADGFTGPLTVDLESSDGKSVWARAAVPAVTHDWTQYQVTLTTGPDAPPSTANRFVISAANPGTVRLNLVSLFPPTYNDRPNGNRIDLMQKLAAMNPAFLRLPGGNYLEGNSFAERFEWKNTIGPLTTRAGHESPWGYRSSDGLGLLEFLEWCEDLHMEPILAVFDGYALDHEYATPGLALQPYVQDALDEIEYVTGGTSTKWGAVRAADGHPKPFPLHYVEIGNEDGAFEYEGRFAQFYDAIKAKYPHLLLIATSHIKSRVPDVVDDHYYRSAAAMERDSTHYDSYSRKGPRIFVGEWASTEGSPTPTLNAALGDAAWLTGLERNSDLVTIASYAPLLVNVNPGAAQWGTNLIGYDALNSYGSPSYYAQAMFSANRGDVTLPIDLTPQPEAAQSSPMPTGGVGVGTWATQAEFRNVKVTQNGVTLAQSDFANGDADWHVDGGTWQTQDGTLQQTGNGIDFRATTGDPNWTDYTYTLQARKISGAEGFLIMFHVKDHDNYTWWNVGGWSNTQTGLEQSVNGAKMGIGPVSPVTIQTGRWYDIRIDVQGHSIKCYLDGKLITQATDSAAPPSPVYATASRDDKSGDVILKVVNVMAAPQQLQISLPGAGHVGSSATAIVLTGQPGDVNSLADPEKVAPRTSVIPDAGSNFVHTFPGYSVTVLRLKTH